MSNMRYKGWCGNTFCIYDTGKCAELTFCIGRSEKVLLHRTGSQWRDTTSRVHTSKKKKNNNYNSHNVILTIFCNYISEVIRSIKTYNVCDGEEVVDEEQV